MKSIFETNTPSTNNKAFAELKEIIRKTWLRNSGPYELHIDCSYKNLRVVVSEGTPVCFLQALETELANAGFINWFR